MKKMLFTGLLASTELFLLGGYASSNANSDTTSEKTSNGKKQLIFGHFGDQELGKK